MLVLQVGRRRPASIDVTSQGVAEMYVVVAYVSLCKGNGDLPRTGQVRFQRQWLRYTQRRLVYLVQTPERNAVWTGSVCATSSVEPVVSVVCEGARYVDVRHSWSMFGKGNLQDSLDALDRMDEQGIVPSIENYRCLLQRCTTLKALANARRVHCHILRNGLESCRYLGEPIVDMFVQCGSLSDAVEVLYRLPERTSFSWTQVISGYVKAGRERDAFEIYQRMQEEGLQPNKYALVSLLKACGRLSNLDFGKRIHLDICRSRCDSEMFVGTTLVAMYAKCGSMSDARHVFDMLSHRDVVSWNAMIAGYTQQNRWVVALELYREMNVQGTRPNSWTFVSVLKACGNLAADEHATLVNDQYLKLDSLKCGKTIHSEVSIFGHDLEVFVGTALLGMYAKCGSMLDAENVFQNLPEHSSVSWNALLSGYVQKEQGMEALQLYTHMQQEGVSPDNWTFVSVLKACGSLAVMEEPTRLNGELVRLGCLQKGKIIFEYAVRKGYRSDLFLRNTLVDIYSDCGSLVDARDTFDALDTRNIVSWNAMIGGYVLQEQCDNALQLYAQLHEEGFTPTNRTFVIALKACGSLAVMKQATLVYGEPVDLNCLQAGKAIHADVIQAVLEHDLLVANSLIYMYAKCGSMTDAQYVFDTLPDSSVVTWTYLITGYAEQEHEEKALQLYAQMQESGVRPDSVTCVSVLKACASVAAKEQPAAMLGEMIKPDSLHSGKRIHEDVVRMGFEQDVHVGTALVNMYAKCGNMVNALQVFEALSQHNVVSWTTMIAGYADQGQGEIALGLYARMQEQGVYPDSYTFVSVLKVCVTLGMSEHPVPFNGENVKLLCLQMCKEVHSEVLRSQVSDVVVSNSLIDTYSSCGSILTSQHVFDTIPRKNLVSWNAMLACYAQQERGKEALHLFAQMQEEALSPNNRTFVSVLQACSNLTFKEQTTVLNGNSLKLACLQKVKAIHDQIDRSGYASNAYVGNTLVRTYAACGSMTDAQVVLDALPEPDVVTWTAIIAAYAEQGQNERAMQQYAQMQKEGVTPNNATFFSVLRACSNAGSLTTCRQIHRDILKTGLEHDGRVATTLIHSYATCGSIVDAKYVFDTLAAHDVFSWTALIAGYARQGEGETSLQLFDEMQQTGIKPNEVTLLAVLAACSHAGLVEQGLKYFEAIVARNDLTLTIDHYVSLVDILGRAGLFDRLQEVLANMPIEPNMVLWLSLLGAAQKHNNLEFGRVAFERAVALDRRFPAPYFLMSNIYSSSNKWVEASQVEDQRRAAGAWKRPGFSWVEHS